MQKKIKKGVIITLFMTSVIISGCCRKDSEIILSEPAEVQEVSAAEASSLTEAETEKTDQSKASEKASEEISVKAEEPEEDIMVHVCGAVMCEGVYELSHGSRVIDAVRAAGGFDVEADTSYVNQAQVLEDGVKLKIPTKAETEKLTEDSSEADIAVQPTEAGITGSTEDKTDSKDGKVNINTASESELCTISGIGPGRAKKILEYREQNGKFEKIEDIMKVSGIKNKFFDKIKDYIKV
ncbi:MAG: ComEA family DNA-binding protein [Butyrivibrio sp.]|nr:ComEA family DNA-binding protein [Butyrivibrio sp.]